MNFPMQHIDCDHAVIPSDIKKHGYVFHSLISLRPSFSLARYTQNDYTVGILQRHLAYEDVSSEFHYWKVLDNRYCLHLYDHFSEGRYEYFVTDPATQGNVTSYLLKNDTNGGGERDGFMREATFHVLMALHYIHCEGLAHLNFEWRHVWIDNNFHFYLGGFENLIPVNRYCVATYGFQAYRPPEVLSGMAPSQWTVQAADIWALGVGLLEIFTSQWVGQTSFRARANEIGPSRLLQSIEENLPSVWERMRSDCMKFATCNFINCLLKFSPSERPTAAEALEFEWIKQPEVRKICDRHICHIYETSIPLYLPKS